MDDAAFERAMRSQIVQLEAQRMKLQSDLVRVDGQLQGLRQALTLYLGDSAPRLARPLGRPARVPDPERNPSWGLVLQVCEGAPPAGVSVDQIEQRVEHAGYKFHRGTLLANLSKAVKAGAVQRVSVGRYRRDRQAPESEPQDGKETEAPDDKPDKAPSGASLRAGAGHSGNLWNGATDAPGR